MNRFPPFLLVLAAVLVCDPAGSAENTSGMDTVVVTASRLDRSVADLAQSVTIVDRAEIEAHQFVSVTELLRHLPGVNVIQQGARGGVTSVVIRGGESNFTVVLIDGVKVNDPTNTRGGSYDFSYLDVASVERVEIVRGPMSAVYGSDALAGVINIVTRADLDGVQLQAEVGGNGLQSGRVSLGGNLGAADVSIAVHALEDEGDIEGAHYEDWGLTGSLGFDVGPSGKAGLQLRYLDANSSSFPEDSGGPVYAVIRDVDVRDIQESQARLYLSQQIGSTWTADFAFSYYERDEDASSPGIAPGVFDGVPPNSADTKFSRDQLSFSFARDVSESIAVVLGGEWQNEDGNSSGVIDIGFPLPTDFELERATLSAFAEGEYKLDALQLLASLRWDDPDDISAELSAQFGAVYSLPGDRGDLRLNWSEGFKAPSFFALGHPLVGNPDLLPETATSVELGYRHSVGSSGMVELSLYQNDFENLIDFDPDLFTNVNRSEVETQGAEVAAEWALTPSLNLDLHISYLDTDIKDSDARLRSRPKWRGGIGVDWSIDDHWQLAASFVTLTEFWEVSIPTGGLFLDGYPRLDFALTYNVNERLRIGMAIDNVLDEEYFEAVGSPSAGVRGRLNASYRF